MFPQRERALSLLPPGLIQTPMKKGVVYHENDPWAALAGPASDAGSVP